MQNKQSTKIKLAWATHKAALYACENWHYSKCMPTGKTVKVGVWEDGIYIGVIIYSYGANNNAPKSFSLTQDQCCELTRVALNKHKTPVSKMLKISLLMLRQLCPKIKLVFSYADKTNQGHTGGIYQANGWLYLGERKTADKGAYYIINGKMIHGRSARAKYGHESKFPNGWTHVPSMTKHLYIKILDKKYSLSKNTFKYPKSLGVQSIDNDASSNQLEEGGVNPT